MLLPKPSQVLDVSSRITEHPFFMMLKHFPAPGPSPMSAGQRGELTDGLASPPDIHQGRRLGKRMALESSQELPPLRRMSSLVYPGPLPGVHHTESSSGLFYFMLFYLELLLFLQVSHQQGTHILPQAPSRSRKAVGDVQRTLLHCCQLSHSLTPLTRRR